MTVTSWHDYASSLAIPPGTLPPSDHEETMKARARELRGYRVEACLSSLLLCAARGETITYSEMNRHIHSKSRWEITHILNAVADVCAAQKWPLLPVLVSDSTTGLPRPGIEKYTGPNPDIKALRCGCYTATLPDPGKVYLALAAWRMGIKH